MSYNVWGRTPASRFESARLGMLFVFSLLFGLPPASSHPAGIPTAELPKIDGFIDEMAQKHGFQRDELVRILNRARLRPAILRAISKPAEGKPWHDYRPIFVNEARIINGVRFMRDHAEALMLSRRAYGVPEELTTAVIGVETAYGKRTGSHRVLDALVTLAFGYPPRSADFRRELEQYLLLTREEDLRPWRVKGSYAGAMGIAQFMPTSYRRYAVDFDRDGKRDLARNVSDAIGSVANYFKVHGWRALAPVAVRAKVSDGAHRNLLKGGLETRRRMDEWMKSGVLPSQTYPGNWKASFVVLKGDEGPEYWLAFYNFYVITRYNRSVKYAMAVFQLSRGIASARRHPPAASAE